MAQYTTEKLIELGGKVATLSDSGGTIYDKDGIAEEKLAWVMDLKNVRRGRIKEYADEFKCEYHEGTGVWHVGGEVALPSATQNELNLDDAKAFLNNGGFVVSEGANMPTTADGVKAFLDAGIMYGPGKAANAGGVAARLRY